MHSLIDSKSIAFDAATIDLVWDLVFNKRKEKFVMDVSFVLVRVSSWEFVKLIENVYKLLFDSNWWESERTRDKDSLIEVKHL